MMQKTKIEWTDYVWNPIKGICPVGCKLPDGKVYCYGKRIYERFRLYPKERFSLLECAKPLHLRKPSKIFVCSTFELFHPIINDRQRDLIFRVIKKCPQHTFQILTKFPQNIDRPMPDNVWLGVTVDEPIQQIRMSTLKKAKAKIKFVSFEPILGRMNNIFFPEDELHLGFRLKDLDWIIIGQLTQHGNKYIPQKIWIQEIVNKAKEFNIPIFLKNNLREIWGNDLIQEFPNEK